MRSAVVARSDRCTAMRSPNKRHHHVRAVASFPGIYGCPPFGGLTNSLHALDEYLVGNKKLVRANEHLVRPREAQQETRWRRAATGSSRIDRNDLS